MRGQHTPLVQEPKAQTAAPVIVHLAPTYDVVATFDLSLAAEALGHNGARNLTTYLMSVRSAYADRTDIVKIRTLIALENPRPSGAGVWKNLICSAGGLNTPEYDAFIHAKDPFDMCRSLLATGTYAVILDKNIHQYMRIWAVSAMADTLLHLHLAMPAAAPPPAFGPFGPARAADIVKKTPPPYLPPRAAGTQRGLVKNPSFSPRWSL